jgi:hypothetical protein
VQLLLVVLHREELLDDLLATLVEFEVADPVVVESRSGLELLERDLPIFAGLRSLIPGGLDFSRLVVSVVEDPTTVIEVVAAVRALGEAVPHVAGETESSIILLPITSVDHF